MTNTDVTHQVKLIDGSFLPSEAKDLINALIDQKINFHKLRRLSLWERDHHDESFFDNNRITQLLQEKKEVIELLKEAKQSGKQLRINGSLNIELID